MRPRPVSPIRWRDLVGFVSATTLAGVLAASPALSEDSVATLRRVAGPVQIRSVERWSEARANDSLHAGDTVRTGPQARATIQDAAGNVTELYPLSEMTFPRTGQFELLVGRLWSHFTHAVNQPWQIRTPAAVALIRGTTLAVEASTDSAEVTVLEGLVEVQGLSDQSRMVEAGRTIRAAATHLDDPKDADPRVLNEGRRFLRDAHPFQGNLDGFLPRIRPDALQRAEAMDGSRTIQMLGGPAEPGAIDHPRSDRPGRAEADPEGRRHGPGARPDREGRPGPWDGGRGDRGDPPGRGRPPREGAPFRRGPWPPGPVRP